MEATTIVKDSPVPDEENQGNPNARVYVGNLPYQLEEEELKVHMTEAGHVVSVYIFRDFGGRSSGCALVEYEDENDAKKAIETLTNTQIMERKIFVREDREANRSPRPKPLGGNGISNFGSGRRGPYCVDNSTRQLFVANLPWNVDWKRLKDAFKPFGVVVRADVYLDGSGKSKGIGTVLFRDESEAHAAIEGMHGHMMGNRALRVSLDKGPSGFRKPEDSLTSYQGQLERDEPAPPEGAP